MRGSVGLKHVLMMLLALSLGFHAAYAGEVIERVKSKGLIRIATDPAWAPIPERMKVAGGRVLILVWP